MSRSKPSRDLRQKPSSGPRQFRNSPPSSARSDRKGITGDTWLYGDHAVLAALANPARKVRRLLLTPAKMAGLDDNMKGQIDEIVAAEIVDRDIITGLLPENALHQGIALLPHPLADTSIEDLPDREDQTAMVVAVLDQVTDPHNVGAILRSAAAFDVKALIVPDRHSPPITGVLAKAASGAIETVPVIRVANLSRALDQLADRGFWRIGLDGQADQELDAAAATIRKVAIVLGSEGKGLRQLSAQKCDLLAKLPINPRIESLNVSNAAAIAFYELARQIRSLPD
ncbi:23S rRNA (guanosine(2251)-2'-O)-methyltransferase RlmB [Sneathiella sp.]|uniref:23S rRNA (guanosine(2251)-2'-O)-methyltransferase RlmB n=1 Tax=Sneathiella sp. TaxID=1964365 RepID=UPI0035693E65